MTAAVRALALPAGRPAKAAVLILATLGASLLLVVALTRWGIPSDEYAYWLAAKRLVAGLPLYDPSAAPGTPYAYFYPPPVAQVLAPFTAFVPDAVFVAAWTVLLLACLWWLGGGNAFLALALVAFVPVSIELWYRNVHLLLAVLIVLGLRRHPAFFAVAAAIKVNASSRAGVPRRPWQVPRRAHRRAPRVHDASGESLDLARSLAAVCGRDWGIRGHSRRELRPGVVPRPGRDRPCACPGCRAAPAPPG